MEPEDELVLIDDRSPYKHSIGSTYRNKENYGNAGAWNRCLEHAKKDTILLTDNDILPSDWREGMTRALSVYEVVFPVVYNERIGREQRHVAGECFMFHRSLYDQIGLFDEEYGSYFEDTDWFQRVMLKGGKLGVAEGTYVAHKSSGTFNKIWSDEKKQRIFERNKKRYEGKFGENYPHL
jgi:GT2 family glycosyltransferase